MAQPLETLALYSAWAWSARSFSAARVVGWENIHSNRRVSPLLLMITCSSPGAATSIPPGASAISSPLLNAFPWPDRTYITSVSTLWACISFCWPGSHSHRWTEKGKGYTPQGHKVNRGVASTVRQKDISGRGQNPLPLGEHGVSFFVRPMENDPHPSVEFRREHFQYDQGNDCFRCPNGKELTLTRVSRNAGSSLHWVYSARQADCQGCPMKERCLNKSLKDKARRLTCSVFEDASQKNLSQADSPEYRHALRLRQIWCEGTFAIQKWSHNLTRVLRRGLEAAEDHCLLSATALNLKRMIKCMG